MAIIKEIKPIEHRTLQKGPGACPTQYASMHFYNMYAEGDCSSDHCLGVPGLIFSSSSNNQHQTSKFIVTSVRKKCLIISKLY